MSALRYIAALLLFTLNIQWSVSQDSTLQPEAKGSKVVEAVVARIEASCVFIQQGRQFARRTAYIESAFGEDDDTYWPGYHGGIWQVDQSAYDTTKTQSGYLSAELANITRVFGIDWLTTQWQDLRMPLFSGLAFRLYITYTSQHAEIPWDISGQSFFWLVNYRPGGTLDEFQNATALETNCELPTAPDLALILDASSNIDSSDFAYVRQIAMNIVNRFEVTQLKTRVAVISYGDDATVQFHLNEYSTKAEVLNHINTIPRRAGSANTHLALDKLVDEVMVPLNGMRLGRPHVGVLISVGYSADKNLAMQAAQRVHQADITMLAIGTGSLIYYDEIWATVSLPKCLHQFLPIDYDEMLLTESSVANTVCEAPTFLNTSSNDTAAIANDVMAPGETSNCRFDVPVEGVTIKVHAHTGNASFLVAHDTFPNEAYYQGAAHATTAVPGSVFVIHTGRTSEEEVQFCYIIGDKTRVSNISIEINPGDREWCRSNPCMNGAPCVDKGNDGYICDCGMGFTGTWCETMVSLCASSPCHTTSTCEDLPGAFHCHCDVGWNGTICDNFLGYNCVDRNPCTLANEDQYYPHANPTQYVECHGVGMLECVVKNCTFGQEWDWILERCDWLTLQKHNKATHDVEVPSTVQHQTRRQSGHLTWTSFRAIMQEELELMETRLIQAIERKMKTKH